ncbi:MAG: YgaP family membrane protein [Pseudomonadota bacterium]
MIRNVGNAERIGRVLVGVGVIAAGVYYQNWLGLIGLLPIATGLTGYCPPYQLLGISTCSVKPAAKT